MEVLLLEYGGSLKEYFSLRKLHDLWTRFMLDRLTLNEKRMLIKLTIFLLWHRRVFSCIEPLTPDFLAEQGSPGNLTQASVHHGSISR